MMILHVDMDAFFASVEERENPHLRGKPVIVGGTPGARGVVAAANYEARKYGIHSAMPATQAARLCPHAVFVRSRMDLYIAVSKQIRAIFLRYTPLMEPLSLDEAFLDVTDSERLFGSAPLIAARIKQQIRDELNLVASVGVARNKFLAKLAGALEKPDGLTIVPDDQVQAFLDPLPVAKLWGVGNAARAALAAIGVATIADLRAVPAATLRAHFGKRSERLLELAHGIDERVVITDSRARSISHETTFSTDVEDTDFLRARMFELTEQVARRARNNQQCGRCVQVKLRYADFRTVTRARTLTQVSAQTDVLWQAAWSLTQAQLHREPGALRLIGIGLSSLEEGGAQQADLFGQVGPQESSAIDQLSDDIAKRFGRSAVHRAGVLRR
ncbi:MAG: DNA polymerase-4 [Gammaproteobacteria bacterium]|jgi:DNA polymerase-4